MLCPGWLAGAGEVVTVTVACITTIIQISSHRAVIKPAPASSGLGWAGLGWAGQLVLYSTLQHPLLKTKVRDHGEGPYLGLSQDTRLNRH